jgi:TolB-like protein
VVRRRGRRKRVWLAELKRRGVLHVTGLYAVGAWAIVQVVDAISGPFPLPEEALRHTWLAALLGFPIAVTFGWRYDLTRQGVVRTNPRSTNGGTVPLARSDYAIMAGLALVVSVVLAVTAVHVLDAIRVVRHPGQEQKLRTSLAVLHFSTCARSEQDEALALGIAGEIIRRLEHIEHLRIIAPSSSFAFRGSGFAPGRIAGALGVKHVVTGMLCEQRGSLQLEIEMVNADGPTVGAVVFEQTDLPETPPLALQAVSWISDELELGAGPVVSLGCRPIGAQNAILVGREFLRRGDLEPALRAFRKALWYDGECGDALAGVVESEVRALDPSDPARETKLEVHESVARQACANAPESDYATVVLAMVLEELGKHEEALDIVRPVLERRNDAGALDEAFVGIPGLRPRVETGDLMIAEAIDAPPAVPGIPLAQEGSKDGPVSAGEAVRRLAQILESDPLNVERVSSLAWAYHAEGEYDRALAAVERLQALPHFPPTAWRTQFHLALRNGRMDTAIGLALGMLSSGGPGIELEPVRRDLAEAGLALGLVGLHDDMNRWLVDLEDALPAEQVFGIEIHRLQILGRAGDAAVVAREWLRQAGEGWWQDADARRGIPRALLTAGDFDAVIRLLEPLYGAGEDAPAANDGGARILGLAYRAAGRDAEADRIFALLSADIPDEEAQVFELGYASPEAFESLADDYLLAGRPYDALEAYETAVDRHCRRRPYMGPGSLWRVVEGHPRLQVLNHVIDEDLARQARRTRALLDGHDVDGLLASSAERWQP